MKSDPVSVIHRVVEFSIMSSTPNPQSDADQLEAAADQAIAACGGDAREAVKALIVANHFLDTELEKLRAAVSTGYARGLPRDRRTGMIEELPERIESC
jgi:hypothetical protein